jgi:uncharacterized protein (TIGR02118 family)
MYRMLVSYGQPLEPDVFDAYYRDIHLPLAGRIPGVRSFAAGHGEQLADNPTSAYFLAEIVFDSREDALAGLSSAHGQAAAADVANFATGGATMAFFNDEIATP